MDTMVPLLKWAGGKRWLIPHSEDIFPSSFNRYIEPFLGGGAIYFHIQPETAILSDINKELIETYIAIRDNWRLVERHLKKHQDQHCKEYYYEVRNIKPKTIATRAARMLYLNRTCWNGLYRLNLKGEFNVPIGTKTKVLLPTDDFESTSKLLQGAQLETKDFEWAIDQAQEGDFVFVDPPYTVKHNLNGFLKYNENLFAWDDQERLAKAVERASVRGAKVLVLNAAHDSIRDLYSGFRQTDLFRNSLLSGKPEFRGKYSELAIPCWEAST